MSLATVSCRITDIEHWRKQIEKALHEVCGEISVLQVKKSLIGKKYDLLQKANFEVEVRFSESLKNNPIFQNSKEACERALEAKALPSDVTTECISIRETRRQFEVVSH